MNYANSTAHNLEQRSLKLNRQIIHFANRIASVGNADTPQKKRALTLALKCLKRSVRDLDRLPRIENHHAS